MGNMGIKEISTKMEKKFSELESQGDSFRRLFSKICSIWPW